MAIALSLHISTGGTNNFRTFNNYVNHLNVVNDILLHSVPVLLCRDHPIAIPTILSEFFVLLLVKEVITGR